MKKLLSLLVLISAVTMFTNIQAKNLLLRADNIDEIVKAMTLDEKVDLMIGTGMMEGDIENPAPVIGATKNIVPGAAGTTVPIPRLGIPSIVLADGPAGLRIDPRREGDSHTYFCTHFPIGTLLASTWDTDLVERVGEAIGNEVLEYGADVLLAPALNIHRHPLCGRNFEYYSEDPVVSGKIAAAYVRGVQANGVGTSIKHFACNNQETNRMANDVRIGQRALREIYLRGFEIAVKESQPWTVMSSYNKVNGTYTSESYDLLTTILRDDWGFRGMVMTDWYGGADAAAQVRAGNDMLQPGYDKQKRQILEAVNNGSLDIADVDRNVRRVLQLIVRTPRFRGYKYSNQPDLTAHAEVTRRAATEGMVLLKNDNNALPLASGVKNVALFGITSYDFIAGGTGSGNVNRAYTVSLTDGMRNAGYQINDTLKSVYDAYLADYEANRPPLTGFAAFLGSNERAEEMELSEAFVQDMAEKNDVAIITLGRISGEFADRTANDFNLSKNETEMIKKVTRAFHENGKRVVVVLNIGGAIETMNWKEYPDAILCAWQPGQEGGNSVADVLSGKANPSGRLTMTFPVKFTDSWSTLNFPLEQQLDGDMAKKDDRAQIKDYDYTDYDEGIYVGYRYFRSKGKTVSYPFGYGLSFTTFSYSKPVVEQGSAEDLNVTVEVTNTGNVAGKTVVELFVSSMNRRIDKPESELKAFCKTRELQPGESQQMTMTLPIRDLASYDEQLASWVVDNGEYIFKVCSSVSALESQSSFTINY